MKALRWFIVLSAFSSVAHAGPAALVEHRMIWDRAPHNAFTDLVRFKGQWYCTFREAKGHVSAAGKIRVIRSAHGVKWASAGLLTRDQADLRDSKLSVTPDGRLMLLAAAAWHGPNVKVNRQPMAWFSKDGQTWSKGRDIGEPNFWLWRVTWRDGIARGIGYGRRKGHRQTRLYESRDGVTFRVLVSKLFDVGYPNEAVIRYVGNRALCLLRRDGSPNTALLGTAEPPYTRWTWKDLGIRVGGPNMIVLPDSQIVAAVRLYKPKTRTALCRLDPQAGKLTELLTLPSGGDTSYAGLVLHRGLLWVSYYSSHEGKTRIYLAKVRLTASSQNSLRSRKS